MAFDGSVRISFDHGIQAYGSGFFYRFGSSGCALPSFNPQVYLGKSQRLAFAGASGGSSDRSLVPHLSDDWSACDLHLCRIF